jgi:hypothetical protein
MPPTAIPPIDVARRVDFILLVGTFGNPTWAGQLAGLLGRVIPEGPVLVIGFPVAIQSPATRFLDRFGISYGGVPSAEVEPVHPAFTDYFALYGQSSVRFDGNEDAETLGRIDSGGGQIVPAAVSVTRGRGAIYALPFVFGGGETQFGELLTAALEAHRADAAGVLPAFLEGLRLPGEDEVLAEIEQVDTKLARLRERAAYLEHFRLLLGPRGTGPALEQLVIEALNVVLEGTEYSAEDREDVGAEDFWIVGPTGDAALAEVKGTNHHVRRDDVNQVDSHRDAADRPQEFPGLLIVNIFRGHHTLEQRELPVPEQPLGRAVNSNVLILRTKDLYDLVALKLGGRDAGQQLVEALSAEGGWLVVTDGAVTVRSEGATP